MHIFKVESVNILAKIVAGFLLSSCQEVICSTGQKWISVKFVHTVDHLKYFLKFYPLEKLNEKIPYTHWKVWRYPYLFNVNYLYYWRVYFSKKKVNCSKTRTLLWTLLCVCVIFFVKHLKKPFVTKDTCYKPWNFFRSGITGNKIWITLK